MKKRIVTAVLVAAALGAVAAAPPQKAAARPAAAQAPAAAGVEAQLQTYALRFLSWDPDSRITVTKSAERLPGMQGYKVVRKGRYEKLNVDRTCYVSDDGKWFFEGDSVANPAPKPIRSAADLSWVGEKFSGLFRTKVTPQLAPERDAPPYRGVNVAVETGYGPVRMPGYVSADGSRFLQGVFRDFRMDPREERRRHIDLSLGRASGKPEAAVSIVEFADMECGYCKMRGLQMDKLLEVNSGIANARRHYKFFPLWFGHVWAMKAASAGDCIFRSAGAPAFFRFKEQVYARQESMTVSGIDEIAVTSAGAEGISSADFLACYLQEASFSRVRHEIEEGYRLGVNSTPTYFIDGTEITWLEDKVMEDFLRTLAPKLKSIFGK
ncbi:MAG: thioredoxin domain-containing protein [Acidobacteria bacterium]|nr:thioredoxin domain-containing protein [Acidobacteriota bacterium]MCA1609864.1 thioredoxin domain-containing protein [Acidobacteriota bacterium]